MVFPGRGLEKSVSVSDGESDSGCSTQTDARHELPPELEYTLGCPSGFSLLLELMTQSPQRQTTRDVLDVNIGSEIKGPGQRLGKDDFETSRVGLELGDVKKFENYPDCEGSTEVIENADMRILLYQDNELNLKTIDPGRYNFEVSGGRNGLKECALYSTKSEFPVGISRIHDGNGPIGSLVSSQTTPIYDLQIYSGFGSKMNNIQRKISFEEDKSVEHNKRRYSLSESEEDQPIDYSQLSSRRKENRNEQTQEDVCHIPDQETTTYGDGQKIKVVKLSETINHTAKKTIASPATTKKYEFILSPKMDSNGNIVLAQSHKLSSKPAQLGAEQDWRGQGNEVLNSPVYKLPTNDNCSPSVKYEQVTPPVSLAQGRCDPKQKTALDIAKAKFEPPQENAGVSKAPATYHPKLKYLLAVSQHNRTNLNDDERQVSSAAATSSNPPYQQSLLFSQEKNAQAEMFVKLNDSNENVNTRSEVGKDQRIPSYEIFHTHTIAPNSNRNNTSVFIINPASTYKTCTSLIDASRGSLVSDKRQQTPDIHSQRISSSPSQISNSFNGSHSSDHFHEEKAQDTCESMYPTSPGRPLSPASLRDQQSALSELLFSTNRKPGVDPYACVDCAKRYSTSSNLARHRQTHRSVCDKKARKCPHCEKVYVSMPAYSMHVRTHNQGCECPHCGKKFSRPWLLQGHIRTHTGEKPFGCPQCGKSFADKSNLRAHIQTHSTEKPYICGRCGKAFALKSYLYKHEESSCMRGQRFRH